MIKYQRFYASITVLHSSTPRQRSQFNMGEKCFLVSKSEPFLSFLQFPLLTFNLTDMI